MGKYYGELNAKIALPDRAWHSVWPHLSVEQPTQSKSQVELEKLLYVLPISVVSNGRRLTNMQAHAIQAFYERLRRQPCSTNSNRTSSMSQSQV